MNVPQRPGAFTAADYLVALRRRWWLVALFLIVGAAAGAAYVTVAPRVFASTASVYVAATGSSAQDASGPASGTVDMASEAQVAQSMAVAAIAAHLLRPSVPPATLSKDISVTVPPNSQVLQITCHLGNPKDAAACAQAFADAYLRNRVATADRQLTAELSTLHSQVTSLQRAMAALTAKASRLPAGSPRRLSDEAQLALDSTQLSSLSNSAGRIAGQTPGSGGRIISNAVAPSGPASPRKLLVLPAGLAAGLVIGLALALVADRRDKRVRGPRDLERRLDLPVLLSVGPDRRGATVATPRSRAGHAYAELARRTAAALGDGNHVMLVTSGSPGAGASLVTANLAAAFTRAHPQVALVCANPASSAVPALFRLSSDRGLADVLAGRATLDEALQRPADFPRLRVLAPGQENSLGAGGFQYDIAHDLVSALRRSTPVVLIEVPPPTEDAGTFALAEFADAALVVVETGKSTWPETEDCVLRLDRLRTTVLGAVLVPRASVPARPRAGGRPPGTGDRPTRHPVNPDRLTA